MIQKNNKKIIDSSKNYSLRSKIKDIPRILESQINLKFDQDYKEKYKKL